MLFGKVYIGINIKNPDVFNNFFNFVHGSTVAKSDIWYNLLTGKHTLNLLQKTNTQTGSHRWFSLLLGENKKNFNKASKHILFYLDATNNYLVKHAEFLKNMKCFIYFIYILYVN